MFDPIWTLDEIKQDKPVKVFSIFSCGGGSSMGYKRAGFEVIGNCEIDPKMNAIYVANNNPKYNYNMDIRDFLKEELPDELYDIDILDGSPPCTPFSIAGDREDSWGKEKVFREGQKAQQLDDLFFVFLDAVEELRPKIVIAENVSGMLTGKAKGYVNLIVKRFREIGYEVQLFNLNAAFMEVPQKRERAFFIANRMGYPRLKLNFKYRPMRFGEVRTKEAGMALGEDTKFKKLLDLAKPSDKSFSDINIRLGNKDKNYNEKIVWDDDICPTVTDSGRRYRGCDKTYFSIGDIKAVSTFPQDFNFIKNSDKNVNFVCGMCVPPNMMAHIATEIWKQWLGGEDDER